MIKAEVSNLQHVSVSYLTFLKVPQQKLKEGNYFLWKGRETPHLINWKIVSRSRKQGGLALSGIVSENVAVLGKSLWRIPRKQSTRASV